MVSNDPNLLEKLTLSAVIPVYRGENFLADLLKELDDFKRKLHRGDFSIQLEEVIFVDDCSIDNSLHILKDLQQKYAWVRVIEMKKNSGQHAATVIGMRESKGDWIVTMDEDLQHRPQDILALWDESHSAGSDLIYALPFRSVHQSLIKNQSSKLIKKFISKITFKKEVNYFNSFRMLKRALVLRALDQFSKKDYLDVILLNHTDKISVVSLDLVDIRSMSRQASGYSFFKLLFHAKRMIFSQVESLMVGKAGSKV
jgi:glycosyltransferase involved in cell wall biosynthesis